jgi:hypothetical protein
VSSARPSASVSDSTSAPTMDPALREMGRVLHERYQLAARIARATWPAEETSPEAMVAATATVFIALNQQLGPGSAGAPAPVGEAPRCPMCQGPMRDQRATKRGNQPDFKCVGASCDGAVWLDRKARAGR